MTARVICRLPVILCLAMAGCRAASLHKDQEDFRCRLMSMYTDQIMDNLIRCHEGMPFVQLDYEKITGTVTQEANAGVSGGQDAVRMRNPSGKRSTTTNPINATAEVAFAVTRTITNKFAYSAGAAHQQQLTVTANPVVDQPTVYRAYLEFLSEPGRLEKSTTPPPSEVALVTRSFGDMFYWVPTAHRKAFRNLALKTTALRGEAIEAPRGFAVTIKGFLKFDDAGIIEADPDGKPLVRQWVSTVVFSPKIPNDEGSVSVIVNGRMSKLKLLPIDALVDPDKETASTDRLRFSYVEDDRPPESITQDDIDEGHIRATPEQLAKALAGQQVSILLKNNRPPIPSTKDLLDSIDHELGIIRLNGGF